MEPYEKVLVLDTEAFNLLYNKSRLIELRISPQYSFSETMSDVSNQFDLISINGFKDLSCRRLCVFGAGVCYTGNVGNE